MPGAYVENGRLMHAGSEIREFGANVPDLLINWLVGPLGNVSGDRPCSYTTAAAADDILKRLVDGGLRFVRFAPFGLRPLTYKASFVDDKARFLGEFDRLVSSAESLGVLLIPSLFFSQTQIPPLFGEPLSSFDDDNSRTVSEMQNIISTLVPRYSGSHAIGIWQFGNEYDSRIGMAIPNYSTDVAMGTPPKWSSADAAPLTLCANATRRFQRLVRKYDSSPAHNQSSPRCTSSGNQGWRYKLSTQIDWDSLIEERLYDDQTDTATFHTYEGNGWYRRDYTGLYLYLLHLRRSLEFLGRPVILGEFGASSLKQPPSGKAPSILADLLFQIETAQIQLALLWNIPANRGSDRNWSLRPDEYRPDEWMHFSDRAQRIRQENAWHKRGK